MYQFLSSCLRPKTFSIVNGQWLVTCCLQWRDHREQGRSPKSSRNKLSAIKTALENQQIHCYHRLSTGCYWMNQIRFRPVLPSTLMEWNSRFFLKPSNRLSTAGGRHTHPLISFSVSFPRHLFSALLVSYFGLKGLRAPLNRHVGRKLTPDSTIGLSALVITHDTAKQHWGPEPAFVLRVGYNYDSTSTSAA